MPFDDNETSDSDSQGLHQSKRTRRLELVQDLLRSIDALAFVEIAILYYCDNATALLFTRSLIQLLFLTPRSPTLPDLPARPHVGLVLGTSAFSVLFHLRKQPRPPETTRGYLTGGLFVDFVGEPGPVSRLKLVSLDLTICLLQLLMMAIHVKKNRLESGRFPVETTSREREERDLEEQPVEAEEGIGLQVFDSTDRSLEHDERFLGEVNIVNDIKQHLASHPSTAASLDANRLQGAVVSLTRRLRVRSGS